MAQLLPLTVADLREWPERCGALRGTLHSARPAIVRALAVLARSRSYEAADAARELQFHLSQIDEILALVDAARAARRAELAAS